MRFVELSVEGAMLIEAEPRADERGALSRLFSRQEFEQLGLMSILTQESVVRTARAGTLRGFHFQVAPSEEAKLVSCVRGLAFDAVLDVRPDSPTFGKTCSITLRGGEWSSIYVPPGCAHAVQTLEDESEMLYRMSCDYDAGASRGYRWNSPGIEIDWPFPSPLLSDRDRELPIFNPARI